MAQRNGSPRLGPRSEEGSKRSSVSPNAFAAHSRPSALVRLVRRRAATNATTTPAAVRYTTVESTAQPPGSILVELTSYAFKPADLSVTSGKVVLYLVNTATEAHAMALRNPAVSVLAVVALSKNVEAGHAAVFTIDDLPIGTYRLTCPIGNHASNGMVGTVIAHK